MNKPVRLVLTMYEAKALMRVSDDAIEKYPKTFWKNNQEYIDAYEACYKLVRLIGPETP